MPKRQNINSHWLEIHAGCLLRQYSHSIRQHVKIFTDSPRQCLSSYRNSPIKIDINIASDILCFYMARHFPCAQFGYYIQCPGSPVSKLFILWRTQNQAARSHFEYTELLNRGMYIGINV